MDKKKRKGTSNKRYKIGYASLALMLGIGIIINYISGGDIHLAIGIFFLGLSIILGILSIKVGQRNNYLLGFSGILAFIGIVSLLTRPKGPALNLGLLIGGILIICALGIILYLIMNKEED
jgi:hypothetical protein